MFYPSTAGRHPVGFLSDVTLAFAGRYAIESEIGEGGSARVFAAHDLKHDRRVAIKILKSSVAQGIAVDRFLREIRIDAGLQHPRILPLYDSGEVLGVPYFVMPLVSGASLRTRLQRQRTLSVVDAVRITTQVADALQHLHSKGFVHRDVKPENILWQDDHVWLADFGIVRALEDANTTSITRTGTAIGTPAYMSPEQRLGSHVIDGRSDQYSLACVLYEMLVGQPPNMLEIAGAQRTPSGARLTPAGASRADIPAALDALLARALRFDENERWPSMQAFSQQLLDLAILTPASSAVVARRSSSVVRRALVVAVGAALSVVAWCSIPPPLPALDAHTVAVLPLAHEGDGAGQVLDGDDCSRFLRDAIGHWTGIRHVDDMQLRDVRLRLGRPESVNAAMTMARRLGAGLAVWGFVGPTLPAANSTTRSIRLFLYDVNNGSPKAEATGLVNANSDVSDAFQILADSLLSGTGGLSTAVRVSGSRNYDAVRAYLDGHRALDKFDLSTATLAFRRAVEIDSRYGLAYLWLAWSTLWLPESNERDWGAAASRALAVGSGLAARDSIHARALVGMYERRFADACQLLRGLTVTDPRDFAAWYGLGECLSSDVTVERNARSPSGWQFRTSIHEAIGAYEKAVDLVPSFTDAMGQRALQQISRWLFLQTGRYRAGMSADSLTFAAWPSLSGDTLAFVPYSQRAVFAESAGTRESSYQQALQQNRDRALGLVNRWVRVDSSNVLALETLAQAREANDELLTLRRAESGLQLTGMSALRQARARATGASAIRLAAMDVRFLIKADRYADAKRLADSLLRTVAVDSASASSAASLYSMAMLTGRVRDAITWGRRSSTFQYRNALRPDQTIPPELSAAASDAATFAALAAPPDSIRAALARTERAIAAQMGISAEEAYQQYVERPLLYAWPSLGPPIPAARRASAGNRWLAVQLALARGDTATARRDMWAVDSSAVRGGVGEVAFEIALLNSNLWLALGDTATAMRVVATALDLVRMSGDQLINRPTATAAFVRLLIQRAALANVRRDEAESRVWGTRAALLWHDADAMLANPMRPITRWRDVPIPGGVK